MDYKVFVLLIITAVYLYQLMLNLIRSRSAGNPVPANVSDVYDHDTYQKWLSYHSEKTHSSIWTSTVSFILDLILFAFNLYSAFASLFPPSPFMQLFAVLLLSELSSLLLLPFSWRDTMVIEEKYGFNKSTAKTFWSDQIKGVLISLLVLVGIGALLMWAHQSLGDWLVLAFAALLMIFLLAVVFLFPLLSRIFNKFKPLEDSNLKEKLTSLLEKNGYRVRDIKVMDASRRTTKSNAYFSGFGRLKTIVLYDTLIESMTSDEICAVFAHELGHGLHRDVLKNQLLSFLQILILSVLAWLTLRTEGIFYSFGFSGINYGFAMILVMSVEFTVIAPLFGLITNHFSRKAEFKADEHAVLEGYGPELISALKKLARQNFSELSPSPLLVKLEYSHPPLSQRIQAIEAHTHPVS